MTYLTPSEAAVMRHQIEFMAKCRGLLENALQQNNILLGELNLTEGENLILRGTKEHFLVGNAYTADKVKGTRFSKGFEAVIGKETDAAMIAEMIGNLAIDIIMLLGKK